MKLLKRLFGAKAQYLLLLTQEQQVKENSKRLGIQSLILSIVGTVLTVAFVVLGALCHAIFFRSKARRSGRLSYFVSDRNNCFLWSRCNIFDKHGF